MGQRAPPRSLRSDGREDFFQKLAVGAGVGGGLGGGRADLAALDHNGAVESAGFQFPEDGGEIDLARAKLDHHVGFAFAVGAGGDGAILGAETGDVREDGLEFGDGIFAGVVDDVAGVIPDFEILVPDGFDGGENFRRGAATAAGERVCGDETRSRSARARRSRP